MGLLKTVVVGTGLLFVGLLVLGAAVEPGQKASAQNAAPTVIPESWRLADHLSVEIQGRSSRMSSVAVLTVKIKNSADVWLKDATILCEFYGQSGTKVGEAKRTAYREFQPKKTVTVRDLNFGFVDQEAQRVGCRVTSAELGSPV
ncbi:MAG: hypothetical protein J0J10_26230 [Bosea sp.]|uniref:hypothetical protein n=1 Tax=Bosea sp. (in: a-proteobacteria) TaxID=1871050 RepID=UPI001ACF5B31|nr:hypothetical protein [Bosea sp. (in: a-proteobacteria)]MBN9472264.1 hypothetical protein [Bosea sp. (in: a-proteobacteria)]